MDKEVLMRMPILPLRDVVVYPHMVIPLFVGREKSIRALEYASSGSKQVLLVAQKEAVDEDPSQESIYRMGTVANLLQLLRLPDGTTKVLVEGLDRGRINAFVEQEPFFLAEVEAVKTLVNNDDQEIQVLVRALLAQFENYVKLGNRFSSEVILSVSSIEYPSRLVDTIAAHMSLKIENKQKILETLEFKTRILELLRMIESEINIIQMEKEINGTVKNEIEKNQREYYLKQKMLAIQRELGELTEEIPSKTEIKVLLDKIEKAGMSIEAKEKALAEVMKLKMMSPLSAEATVVRNYIDWMLDIPWHEKTTIQHDLTKAQDILNKDHYGLDKVKDRILEYLAVQLRVEKMKGPVLCLVGPPGVGKTSLGESIARATGRTFVRMSLGGLRDEAEIRGHRKTYIGALPGKILQKLAKAKVKNPLFLLDEIDKMSMDFRGDPASALLEVLDPAQNHAFNDHYLEVDYDLSDVMFVATANSLNIPLPLLDRLEVIRLSGYTEDEKSHIAQSYLIPAQMLENGLQDKELSISQEAILEIIRYYTRESGVRGLERELSTICRKVVKSLLLSKAKKPKRLVLGADQVETYLGVRRYRFGQVEELDQIGQVTGLAWTEVGGEILTIEVMAVPGKGQITSTGKLGEVMQESIQAAITVLRVRSAHLGIADDFYEKHDIHIHVPEGATPKDGPSAGIGMCTALVSVLTGIAVRKDVAMTGEITLRGQVLPIGGLKEKLLAARRAGIRHVIIPDQNKPELSEIPESVYEGMEIHPVRYIDEVFELALVRSVEPLKGPIASDSLGLLENPVISEDPSVPARH